MGRQVGLARALVPLAREPIPPMERQDKGRHKMKIEVEIRVKITENADARTVTSSEQFVQRVGDNPRFVVGEARKALDHVEENILTAIAIAYPPRPADA